MNREELDAFRLMTAMPADLMAKKLNIIWLDQKPDALKCTSRAFAHHEYVETRQEVFDSLATQLEAAGCQAVWLIACYPIFSEEANAGFIHIVVTGVFE